MLDSVASSDDEKAVFVSPDGRRRRRARWLGRALAGSLAAWLVAVGIGAAGFLRMPPLAPVHLARVPITELKLIQARAPRAHAHSAVAIARRVRPHQAKLDRE
jgi:hypothetical protein